MNISDEAVEAAAEIAFNRHGAKYYSQMGAWADLEPRFRTAWIEDARQILKAAAPHMLAEAWEEGREADDFSVSIGFEKNPYRPAP